MDAAGRRENVCGGLHRCGPGGTEVPPLHPQDKLAVSLVCVSVQSIIGACALIVLIACRRPRHPRSRRVRQPKVLGQARGGKPAISPFAHVAVATDSTWKAPGHSSGASRKVRDAGKMSGKGSGLGRGAAVVLLGRCQGSAWEGSSPPRRHRPRLGDDPSPSRPLALAPHDGGGGREQRQRARKHFVKVKCAGKLRHDPHCAGLR